MRPLRYGSYCTGLDVLGFVLSTVIEIEYVFAVEIDRKLRQLIEQRYATTVVLADACKVDPESLPALDIFSCGFPCQPFSLEGQKKGTEDDRFAVFEAVHRYHTRSTSRFQRPTPRPSPDTYLKITCF